MPQDRSGHELRVGDRVSIPCVVKKVALSDEYVNVELETIEPQFPDSRKNWIVLNGKQVDQIPPPPTRPAA